MRHLLSAAVTCGELFVLTGSGELLQFGPDQPASVACGDSCIAREKTCHQPPGCRGVLAMGDEKEGKGSEQRSSEVFALRWGDLDLKRGLVRLDENKTDEPRAWALNPHVVKALRYYRRSTCKPHDLVFRHAPGSKDAEILRADLQTAGVTRSELFESSKTRLPFRLHDLRGTFVTVSLANGRTETWAADRTGHRSSQMINTYRRVARTAAEVGVGDLVALDAACPEFWGPKLPGETWPEIWPKTEVGPAGPAKKSMISSGSTGTRTLDRRIKSPQLYQLSYRPGRGLASERC